MAVVPNAWAEDPMSEERLRADGFLAIEPIREQWSEHISGGQNWHDALWDILIFQSWLILQP